MRISASVLCAALLLAPAPVAAQEPEGVTPEPDAVEEPESAEEYVDLSLPDGDWYVGVHGGPAWFDGPAETGFTGGASIGYDLKGPLRAELDVAYHQASVEFAAFGFPGTFLDTTIDAWTVMLNGYYDLRLKSRFTPYAGFGVGYSKVGVETEVIDPLTGTILSAEVDDSGFNFNLMAGVAYNLSQGTALIAQYRYSDDAGVNAIEVGARFGF